MKEERDCRHWRNIRPAKATSVPNWHVYLSTANVSKGFDVDKPGGMTVAVEAGLRLVRHRGIHSSVPLDEEYLPENVWHDEVTKYWPKTGTVWIWSLNLATDLTLTYWWDLHQQGRFKLTMPRKCVADVERMKAHMFGGYHGYAVLSNPPTIIQGWLDGHKVVLVDIRNWFDTSLESLAKMVAGDRAIYLLAEMQSADSDRVIRAKQELTERCSLAIMDTVRLNDGGKLRPTVSAQGWEAWRRNLASDIPTVHGNADALVLERDSLYGGLVESFWVGEVITGTDSLDRTVWHLVNERKNYLDGPIYRVDVQSLYPAMMFHREFPLRLLSHDKGNINLCNLDMPEKSIARVKLRIPQGSMPMPVRTSNGVMHATGEFVTTLAGPDLDEAEAQGYIVSCGELTTYEMGCPFVRFVDNWWRIKNRARWDNKPAVEYLAKRILNGVYGKCAQRQQRWVNAPGSTALRPWGHWTTVDAESGQATLFRSLGGEVQRQEQPRWVGTLYDLWQKGEVGPEAIARLEAPLSLPSIAAYITAYARQEMYRLIDVAGPRNVLMCQTDCLWITQQGLDNLQMSGEIMDGELGKPRLVDSTDSAEIRSPYWYRYGKRQVISGIPFEFTDSTNSKVTVRQDQSLHEILLTGQTGYITWKDVTVAAGQGEVRGKIGPDGWVTSPVLGG